MVDEGSHDSPAHRTNPVYLKTKVFLNVIFAHTHIGGSLIVVSLFGGEGMPLQILESAFFEDYNYITGDNT